jgi:formate-dependent nitrite reductase cytochrome c552 subunit
LGYGDGIAYPSLEPQRMEQWRLDFVAAEKSTCFHAPAEAACILAESIDDSHQAQIPADGSVRSRVALHP